MNLEEIHWAVTEATIPGKPKEKERPRKGEHGQMYTPRAVLAAEDAIGWDLKAAGARPLDGDVYIELVFYLPDKRRVDMDNLEKLVLDAANGIAYKDDSQVVDKHTHLVRGSPNPRTEIKIKVLVNGAVAWEER